MMIETTLTLQCALKEQFAWLMVEAVCKDVLKSATTTNGALSVMTVGGLQMLWLCVDNLDSRLQVQTS